MFLAKLVPLFLAGLDVFGLVHITFLELTVVVPLLGLALLIDTARRSRRLSSHLVSLAVGAAPMAMLLLAPVGAYASWLEPGRLQVEMASLDLRPGREGREPIRIGVMADIQTARVSDYEQRAVDWMTQAAPDLIVLPGDLFQRYPGQVDEDLDGFHDLLGRLDAPGGVFFVLGNVDSQPGIERIVAGTQVQLLVNESRPVSVRDRRITLAGIELNYRSAAARQTIERLEADDGADVRLLLTHMPDPILALPSPSRIDLVVAGHTHGGQIQLPFFGPPATASTVPRSVGAGGLHEVGMGRMVYVSRGVGMERGQAPPIRFLCPPDISVVELR